MSGADPGQQMGAQIMSDHSGHVPQYEGPSEQRHADAVKLADGVHNDLIELHGTALELRGWGLISSATLANVRASRDEAWQAYVALRDSSR